MQVVDITTNSQVQTNVGRINVHEARKDNQWVKITNQNRKYQKKGNITQQYIDT